jgi:hypothetical protein
VQRLHNVRILDRKAAWNPQRVNRAADNHGYGEREKYNAAEKRTAANQVSANVPATDQTQTSGYRPDQATDKKPGPRSLLKNLQHPLMKSRA